MKVRCGALYQDFKRSCSAPAHVDRHELAAQAALWARPRVASNFSPRGETASALQSANRTSSPGSSITGLSPTLGESASSPCKSAFPPSRKKQPPMNRAVSLLAEIERHNLATPFSSTPQLSFTDGEMPILAELEFEARLFQHDAGHQSSISSGTVSSVTGLEGKIFGLELQSGSGWQGNLPFGAKSGSGTSPMSPFLRGEQECTTRSVWQGSEQKDSQEQGMGSDPGTTVSKRERK